MQILTDDEMIAVLIKRGGGLTVTLANQIRDDYPHHKQIATGKVLRHLKKLERRGLVKRVRTSYLVQINWEYISPAPIDGQPKP